jgi:hypothetical protein
MTRDEQVIRDMLGGPAAPDAARFSAEVLFRLGRRRRVLRNIARVATLTGLMAPAVVLAPRILAAFAPLGASIDPRALAAGLLLLLICAVAAPLRA